MPQVENGPKELNDILESSYTQCMIDGDEEKCSKISWGAAKRAGWEQDENGQWAKKKHSIFGKEIFSVGTWNGDEYSMSDLEDIVKAYAETSNKYKPYLKLGHEENQAMLQKEGLPSAGWIENLRIDGDKLVCDIADVPDKVYKLIENNAYRYVSSEIFWNIDFNGKEYNKMLAGVALLGSEMPAVTNLNDFVNLYKLDAKFIKTYTRKDNGGNMPGINEEKKPVDAESKAPPMEKEISPEEKAKMEAEAAAKKKMEDDAGQIASLMGEINNLKAKLEEIMTQLNGAKEETAKYKADAEKAELDAMVRGFAPSAQEYARLLLGPDKKEYSMGEKKLNKKEILENIVKIYSASAVNLDENSVQGGKVESENDEDKTIGKIREYAKEKNITNFRDAHDAYFKELDAAKSADASDEDNEEE